MADISAHARQQAAAKGDALAGGRFPIRNRADLANAIRAIGRANPEDRAQVRRFVMKRARALNAISMIPPTWNADGTLKGGAQG